MYLKLLPQCFIIYFIPNDLPSNIKVAKPVKADIVLANTSLNLFLFCLSGFLGTITTDPAFTFGNLCINKKLDVFFILPF